MNMTDSFIKNLISLGNQELPERINHQVKRCVLDYLGVTYAGAASAGEKLEKYYIASASHGDCCVIGQRWTADYVTAGFMNGFSSHYLELDDGHRFGMLHLGAPIISAMIAVAQQEKISSEQFIKGVVIGYEATVRLAMAIQPAHKHRGFHASGTCGTIGVACAIGAALNFNAEQLKNAISAAATSAAGLLEVIDDSSELKPYNIARAVMDGIVAANIGWAGFSGPDDVLGGRRGFFTALSSDCNPEMMRGHDGCIFAIEKIYVKPYAACRHCHSAIEGALNIGKREKIDCQDIEEVAVGTYKMAVLGHDHTEIAGVSSAKMSTPYSVAASLILREAGMDAFVPEMVNKKNILDLCCKVHVYEDEELTLLSPEKRGAVVQVVMKDKAIFTERVDYPLGEPENSISDSALEEKFMSLMAAAGKTRSYALKLRDIVWDIDHHLEELLQCL